MGPSSMDLRERIAAAIDAGEGSHRPIARRCRVSVSVVTRLLKRRRDAGTLAPKPHGGGTPPSFGLAEEVRLVLLIIKHPDATRKRLKASGGFTGRLTTIWRALRRFRPSSKKKTLHAAERDDPAVQAKRRRYRDEVAGIDADRLKVVDESGINDAMTPTPAWAPVGARAIGSVPAHWSSTTVIAAMGLDGVWAPFVFPGATDEPAFRTDVEAVLAPCLRPGDVVVFDHLAPHHAAGVVEAIRGRGATAPRLPP